MSDGRSSFGLLLPFDVDDPEFVRGFEAGHVWTKLKNTDARVFTVHGTNAEMMLRIGEALNLFTQSEEVGDGWLIVTFAEALEEPQP